MFARGRSQTAPTYLIVVLFVKLEFGEKINYTLRLKAAQCIAPQFRNDGKAAFAKLLGFGALPRIIKAKSAESKNISRALAG